MSGKTESTPDLAYAAKAIIIMILIAWLSPVWVPFFTLGAPGSQLPHLPWPLDGSKP
jgi:hypothetical protein